MRNFFVALGFTLMLAASFVAAADTPPPGNVYETSPFNANPKLFSSISCGAPFSCSAEGDNDIMVRLANQCASSRLGFPATIMGKLMSRGAYKSCVIPSTYAPTGPGMGAKAQWPVCCIKEGDNNACQMTCHIYITNDVQ